MLSKMGKSTKKDGFDESNPFLLLTVNYILWLLKQTSSKFKKSLGQFHFSMLCFPKWENLENKELIQRKFLQFLYFNYFSVTLWLAPFVEVPAEISPTSSMNTMPIVSWLNLSEKRFSGRHKVRWTFRSVARCIKLIESKVEGSIPPLAGFFLQISAS